MHNKLSNRNQVESRHISMSGQFIAKASNHKFLGVFIDDKLKFDKNICESCSKVSQSIGTTHKQHPCNIQTKISPTHSQRQCNILANFDTTHRQPQCDIQSNRFLLACMSHLHVSLKCPAAKCQPALPNSSNYKLN